MYIIVERASFTLMFNTEHKVSKSFFFFLLQSTIM